MRRGGAPADERGRGCSSPSPPKKTRNCEAGGAEDEEEMRGRSPRAADEGRGCSSAGTTRRRPTEIPPGSLPLSPPPQHLRHPPLPPPPTYDGSKNAADAFADPYFYDSESDALERAPVRQEALQTMSVRQAFQDAFAQHGVEALAVLAKSIRARGLQLRHYYNGETNSTKQRFVARAIESKYECRLIEALIPVGTLTSALAPLLVSPGESTGRAIAEEGDDDPSKEDDFESRRIDLTFLNNVMADEDDELFLATDQVYVRDSMRRVFALFSLDVTSKRKPGKKASAALVGSPGVGKSILFFLAALYQATESNVVYYRRSGEEPVSVFVMALDDGKQNVRVWCSRNVKTDFLGAQGLTTLSTDLKRSRIVDDTKYSTFVDGPKYGDIPNTLDGNYDYLCTSGGFLLYPNEEKRKRLWILDGWNEEEAIRYLVHAKRFHVAEGRDGSEKARKAYWLCGGNIRDMLDAFDNEVLVISNLNTRLRHLSSSMVELALISTERGNEDKSNPDRLRTMFWERKSVQDHRLRMCGLQVVDSRYVLNYLRLKLDIEKVHDAYKLLKGSLQRGPEGCLFELTIHRIVHSRCNLPENSVDRFPNVHRVCWSEAETWKADMDALCEPSVYWVVPKLSNFPSIDSAIVHDNTLYAFHMRVSCGRKFNVKRFREFEAAVRSKAPFSGLDRRVVVYFVSPAGTGVAVPDPIPNVMFRSHEVDADSINSLSSSLRRLLAFDCD